MGDESPSNTKNVKGVETLQADVILPSSPLFLHPSDAPSQVFVGDLLTDLNYSEWSAEISNAFLAKNKLDFVLGTVQRPASGELLAAWTRCNAMVVGWLRSAMSREIRSSLSTSFTAKEIWDELKERFTTGNLPRRYKLRREITSLRQDKLNVASFYAKLKRLWDDWFTLDPPAKCTCGKCECDVERRTRASQEDMRFLDFLLGLDDGFSVVRTQLLSMKPTPSLGEAYHMVANDEQQRLLTDSRPRIEAAAFQGKGEQGRREDTHTEGRERTEEGRPYCTHCQKPGHFKATCYEIHGWPTRQPGDRPRRRGKSGRDPQAAAAESEPSSIPGLSAAQVAQLRAFLESDTKPTASMAVNMSGTQSFRSQSPTMSPWIIYSGCNEHIVNDNSLFVGEIKTDSQLQVRIPNGKGVPVHGIGITQLSNGLVLRRVLHVPDFQCNLLSVSRLTADHSVAVVFLKNFCVIQDLCSKKLIGTGTYRDGLYYLNVLDGGHPVALSAREAINTSARWHSRLGHPADSKLLAFQPFISSTLVLNKDPCDSCLRAKQTRLPFEHSQIKTTSCFDLIHVDLWGGYHETSFTGAHYFLTIVDDFSRAVWVFLLKYKSEAARYLLVFFNQARTQYGKSVRRIQTDNGREFTTPELRDYYEKEGVVLQTSCINTPQQNGVVERKHRHLLDTARALRFHAGLPLRFWGECVLTAAYLINRMPLAPLHDKSPYQVLFDVPPKYDHLRTLGCLVYAKDTHHHLDKFAARGRPGIFIGYPATQKGYRIYDLEKKQIYTSRDVVFVEHVFPYKESSLSSHSSLAGAHDLTLSPDGSVPARLIDDDEELFGPQSTPANDSPLSPTPNIINSTTEHSSPSPSLDAASPGDTSSSVPTTSPAPADVPPLRRSDRTRQLPKALDVYDVQLPGQSQGNHVLYPMANHVSYHRLSPAHRAFIANVTNTIEPRYYHQAVCFQHWRLAMQAEITALEANHTWTLTYLPPGKRAIESKWVFKVKYKPDGSIERYKARLVAKGFTRVEGIDYHDTFAPVAKLVTVRCLLAVAVTKNWFIHQLDVNNAFLHGDLHEEVYMKVPQGFGKPGDTRVCKLHKSIYGLKQASRNWYQKFSAALVQLGFRQSHADPSLFIYHTSTSCVVALIYVDDVILAGDNLAFIQRVKSSLHSQFTIKDLGPLKYFLGIEVARSPKGVVLNQRKYVLDILADSGLPATRPCASPIEQNHQLGRLESPPAPDPSAFRRLVGRLLYLTVTRPDITYSVNLLSQAVHAPTQAHLDAAHRILRYLKSSPGRGLFFPSQNPLILTGYCDADWGGCPTTRRSTTGYFIRLGASPVSWRTKKQTVVARSSAEAEYRAMASTVSEIIWLRWLLSELGAPQQGPTPLFCDSQAALHIAANPVFHERTKHVEMDCHFVRERVQSRDIAPQKISSPEKPADLFTKGLGVDSFQHLLSKLGTYDLHASA
ncbi:unnamed protein product [Linum trigynum]|uniref:Integrase catalytic domain-containing protein n=1 Tax=Linum trigynum TaxID=586398 RepID=A0AAV2CJP1_9ROSI